METTISLGFRVEGVFNPERPLAKNCLAYDIQGFMIALRLKLRHIFHVTHVWSHRSQCGVYRTYDSSLHDLERE